MGNQGSRKCLFLSQELSRGTFCAIRQSSFIALPRYCWGGGGGRAAQSPCLFLFFSGGYLFYSVVLVSAMNNGNEP